MRTYVLEIKKIRSVRMDRTMAHIYECVCLAIHISTFANYISV